MPPRPETAADARPDPLGDPDVTAHDLDPDRFADALLRALDARAVSQRELARRLGIRQQSVSGWIHGRARPSTENLRATLSELEMDWDDVRRRGLSLPTPTDNAATTTISVFTDIRASGGPGFSVDLFDGDEDRRLEAAKELLFCLVGIRPADHLGAIYVEGDSMVDPRSASGGLPDGQLILFEPSTSFADFRSGARHVLVHEGPWGRRVLVKRLHLGLDGALTVASDNPRLGDLEERLVPAPDSEAAEDGTPAFVSERTRERVDVTIVGRVVWPRETDDEQTVRAVTEALERAAAAGLFSK